MPASTPLFANPGRNRAEHSSSRAASANFNEYPLNAGQPLQQHDETLFAEKARKFDEADASFRALVDSLNEYKAAMVCLLQCGVNVAKNMDTFFAVQDRPHKDVSVNFVDALLSIQSKWLSHAERNFDDDVLAPIQSRVDEIPDVRKYMKLRSDALIEMQKRQKKLHTDRKKDGNKFREKQRVLRDRSDRYAMFHDEVVKRFNYIERNMGVFVTAPLRSLVSIMADVSATAVETLGDLVKMVSETPPITRDLTPVAPMSLNDGAGGIIDYETWDDSFQSEHSEDDFDIDQCETDSTSAPATRVTAAQTINVGRPPRVRSADPVPKAQASSSIGVESTLTSEAGPISNNRPRRGRSASSAPPETTAAVPMSIPTGSLKSLLSHPPSYAGSTASEHSRKRDGKGSVDTVGSIESLGRNEILMRLVSKYVFTPVEANELELHVGDVIEVTAKNDSGWWCGQCGKSRGYFPENYTRPLSEQEELDYLAERERRRKRRGHRREKSHDSRRSGQPSHSFVPTAL